MRPNALLAAARTALTAAATDGGHRQLLACSVSAGPAAAVSPPRKQRTKKRGAAAAPPPPPPRADDHHHASTPTPLPFTPTLAAIAAPHLRAALLLETASVALLAGARAVRGRRHDAALFEDAARGRVAAAAALAPRARARPSALTPAAAAAGFALGAAAAALAPPRLRAAIAAAGEEVAAETYNRALGAIRTAGLADTPDGAALRASLRVLRDGTRAPEGGPAGGAGLVADAWWPAACRGEEGGEGGGVRGPASDRAAAALVAADGALRAAARNALALSERV
jgi:ubiquinone biosynthesis monooxygenase Coq7